MRDVEFLIRDVSLRISFPIILATLNDFLEFTLPDLLHDVPLEMRNNLKYYRHDGAPAHNVRIVRRYST